MQHSFDWTQGTAIKVFFGLLRVLYVSPNVHSCRLNVPSRAPLNLCRGCYRPISTTVLHDYIYIIFITITSYIGGHCSTHEWSLKHQMYLPGSIEVCAKFGAFLVMFSSSKIIFSMGNNMNTVIITVIFIILISTITMGTSKQSLLGPKQWTLAVPSVRMMAS